MTDQPWYADGLRFSCTACGECCKAHGEYSYVYLTTPEIAPLAAALKISEEAFLETYCEQERDWVVLRAQDPACPFLQDDGRCGVYEARPMQCRTWPFWQENLKEATWKGPVKAVCPGLDTGTLHTAEEAEGIAEHNEQWYESDGSPDQLG